MWIDYVSCLWLCDCAEGRRNRNVINNDGWIWQNQNLIKWVSLACSDSEPLLFLFLFQSSYPIWEDFNSKATKLHSQLRWVTSAPPPPPPKCLMNKDLKVVCLLCCQAVFLYQRLCLVVLKMDFFFKMSFCVAYGEKIEIWHAPRNAPKV